MELLLGKGLAAGIPAILATYGAFIIFIGGAFVLLTNKGVLLAMLDPRWLIAIFIVGPLLTIMAVFFSLIVSSRVNDPRVAEQLSAVLIVPVLLFFFGQMSGLFLINRTLILVVAFIALALDVFLAYLSAQLFQRETILTRWK
jgi:ABC-2 type transport system permease protein